MELGYNVMGGNMKAASLFFFVMFLLMNGGEIISRWLVG